MTVAQRKPRDQGVALRTQGRKRLRTEAKAGRFHAWSLGHRLKLLSLGTSWEWATKGPSTWRTRFILPMWIMKPSVQAMSEGEWPPPTTFTLLFCCRARASTCREDSVSQDLLREEAREPFRAGGSLQGVGRSWRGCLWYSWPCLAPESRERGFQRSQDREPQSF